MEVRSFCLLGWPNWKFVNSEEVEEVCECSASILAWPYAAFAQYSLEFLAKRVIDSQKVTSVQAGEVFLECIQQVLIHEIHGGILLDLPCDVRSDVGL